MTLDKFHQEDEHIQKRDKTQGPAPLRLLKVFSALNPILCLPFSPVIAAAASSCTGAAHCERLPLSSTVHVLLLSLAYLCGHCLRVCDSLLGPFHEKVLRFSSEP